MQASSFSSDRAPSEQVTQGEGSALPTSAPSAKRPSIFTLADLACAMPWEDKAPISARLDFKDAVTPELFVELVQALLLAKADAAYHLRTHRPHVLEAIDAAIAKATGEQA